MVVGIPDEDLIKSLNFFEFGISAILEAALRWTVTNMNRAVEAKKQNMINSKPGLVEANEPKMIWMKMICHLNAYSRVTAFRSKFNLILEKILAEMKHHYIVDVNKKVNYPHNFTLAKFMNRDGKVMFWREVNMQLRKFGFREANLRPIKVEPVIMDSGQRDRSTGGESSRNVSGKDGHYRGFNNRFKKNYYSHN